MKNFLATAALLTVLGGIAAACGDDDEGNTASGNGTDRAFARAMVPHHELAVEMAEMAEERGDHAELKRLAGQIIRSQTGEIRALRQGDRQLAEDGVKSGELGVPEHLRGMEHDPGILENAAQFDREFIAQMIPHHQGAIRMSRVELRRGEEPRLRRLAREIIDAQQREIKEMRAWSKRWYGSADHIGH